MKRRTKVCLVIALVCFVFGIVLFGAAACIGGNPLTAIEEMSYETAWDATQFGENFDAKLLRQDFETVEEIYINELERMDINIGIGAVVIKPVSADACRVLVQDSSNFGSIRSSVDTLYNDGILTIEDDWYDRDWSFSLFSPWRFRKNNFRSAVKVIIELPKQYAGDIDAHVKVGALKCYELKAGRIDFLVDAGAMYGVDSQQADTINLTVSLGEMKFENLKGKHADFSVDMGDLHIDHAEIDQISASCDMGNLDLESLLADQLTADCNMGNINVKCADVTDLNATCDMGNINLQMVGMPEDYFITTDVDMGDVDIEDRGRTYNRDAEKTLQLNCDMGDIDVTFTGLRNRMDKSL